MAKTARDARKHLQAWSNFFADLIDATEEEVDAFLEKSRKRKYTRQSLQRLCARGFLVKKANSFIPTQKGRLFFSKQKLSSQGNTTKKWDGRWRLISFDVPVKYDAKRSELRALLKEFDFYQLQKSVWVSPKYLSEGFWKLIVSRNLHKYCKAMTVDIIEGDGELRKYFKI